MASEFVSIEERDACVLRLHRKLKWTERAIAQALGLSMVIVLLIIEKHEEKAEVE